MMVVRLLATFVVLALLLSCSGGTQDAAMPQAGVTLKRGVVFNHTPHSTYSCDSCHQCGVGDGKISFLGKEWAHITCKDCHAETQQGPVSCKGCHLSMPTTKTVASSVSVIQTDSAVFTVYGLEMDGVADIQLDIAYDAAVLTLPTVTSGSLTADAMFAANTSIPGVIKIAIVSTHAFVGSGQIAVIRFSSNVSVGGYVYIRSISTINAIGYPVPVGVTITSLNGTVPVQVPAYYPPALLTASPSQSTQTSTPSLEVTTTPAASTIYTPIFSCN